MLTMMSPMDPPQLYVHFQISHDQSLIITQTTDSYTIQISSKEGYVQSQVQLIGCLRAKIHTTREDKGNLHDRLPFIKTS